MATSLTDPPEASMALATAPLLRPSTKQLPQYGAGSSAGSGQLINQVGDPRSRIRGEIPGICLAIGTRVWASAVGLRSRNWGRVNQDSFVGQPTLLANT